MTIALITVGLLTLVLAIIAVQASFILIACFSLQRRLQSRSRQPKRSPEKAGVFSSLNGGTRLISCDKSHTRWPRRVRDAYSTARHRDATRSIRAVVLSLGHQVM